MILHKVGIDVRTKDAAKLARRLRRLKGTALVTGPFPYGPCPGESQLQYAGDMDEAALDAWLYTVKHGSEYTGTFKGVW